MAHDKEKPELLPCPFCGSRDLRFIRLIQSGAAHHKLNVECQSCSATGGHLVVDALFYTDEEELEHFDACADIWNIRAENKL